jgi:hypothetical protein
MKSPNSIHIEPRRSVVHVCAVVALAIILIAIYVYLMPGNGSFGVKNGLWMAAAALVTVWAWASTWQLPTGQLHFAQGQWTWCRAAQELPGTLHLHLDLQNYMLVRFQPNRLNRFLFGSIFSTTAPWFHLEARHFSATAQSAENPTSTWSNVRRAVYFPSAASTEPLSLKDAFNEKPSR